MKQVRRDGIEAAFSFLRARASFTHGEWIQFVDLHTKQISLRTVQFYCQLAERAREWVLDNQPSLTDLDSINRAAVEMVMQSPKPLIALCRELGHLRQFGEYDAVKYAERKGGSTQIEFDFAKVMAPLELLAHIGDDNYRFNYPDGVDETAYISEVETKLEAALVRVRQIKKNGRIIET